MSQAYEDASQEGNRFPYAPVKYQGYTDLYPNSDWKKTDDEKDELRAANVLFR